MPRFKRKSHIPSCQIPFSDDEYYNAWDGHLNVWTPTFPFSQLPPPNPKIGYYIPSPGLCAEIFYRMDALAILQDDGVLLKRILKHLTRDCLIEHPCLDTEPRLVFEMCAKLRQKWINRKSSNPHRFDQMLALPKPPIERKRISKCRTNKQYTARLEEVKHLWNGSLQSLVEYLLKDNKAVVLSAVIGKSISTSDDAKLWMIISDRANLSLATRLQIRRAVAIPSEEALRAARAEFECEMLPIDSFIEQKDVVFSKFNLKERVHDAILLRLRDGILPLLPSYQVKISGDGYKRFTKSGQVQFSIQLLDMPRAHSANATVSIAIAAGGEGDLLLQRICDEINSDVSAWQDTNGQFRLPFTKQLNDCPEQVAKLTLQTPFKNKKWMTKLNKRIDLLFNEKKLWQILRRGAYNYAQGFLGAEVRVHLFLNRLMVFSVKLMTLTFEPPHRIN